MTIQGSGPKLTIVKPAVLSKRELAQRERAKAQHAKAQLKQKKALEKAANGPGQINPKTGMRRVFGRNVMAQRKAQYLTQAAFGCMETANRKTACCQL